MPRPRRRPCPRRSADCRPRRNRQTFCAARTVRLPESGLDRGVALHRAGAAGLEEDVARLIGRDRIAEGDGPRRRLQHDRAVGGGDRGQPGLGRVHHRAHRGGGVDRLDRDGDAAHGDRPVVAEEDAAGVGVEPAIVPTHWVDQVGAGGQARAACTALRMQEAGRDHDIVGVEGGAVVQDRAAGRSKGGVGRARPSRCRPGSGCSAACRRSAPPVAPPRTVEARASGLSAMAPPAARSIVPPPVWRLSPAAKAMFCAARIVRSPEAELDRWRCPAR